MKKLKQQRLSKLPVFVAGRSVTCKVHLKRPHDQQARVLSSKALRRIIRAGRQGGKTTIAANIAVECFLQGLRVLYAVPTSDQLLRWWIEVNSALVDPIEQGVYQSNETLHTIERSKLEHARIRGKTAWNADSLRGDFADVLILDEYQLMAEDTWHQVGAPMLVTRNGKAVFIFTPPSLTSRSASKAVDKKHANKLYKYAQRCMKRDIAKGVPLEWETFTWTSIDNPFVSRAGLEQVVKDMTATAYRQEILAEDVEEAPGALWNRKTIEKYRVEQIPESLISVVVGVDPPGSTAECGIVVAASGLCSCKGKEEVHGFILEDASLPGAPSVWAGAVSDAYEDWSADALVAEENFGGPMVEKTIRTANSDLRYIAVHASRGKAVRAEPISVLCEQGKIHHVGHKLSNVEDEMCLWVPGTGAPSPNRLDAYVWALTRLFPSKKKRRKVQWVPRIN